MSKNAGSNMTVVKGFPCDGRDGFVRVTACLHPSEVLAHEALVFFLDFGRGRGRGGIVHGEEDGRLNEFFELHAA